MNIALSANCIICLALLLVEIGYAAGLADEKQTHFSRIGTEDGLSVTVVSAIVQDKRGFVWIGTQNGLNRYDGYAFETYSSEIDDTAMIPDDYISALLVDSQDRFWIGTDRMLSLYDFTSGEFSEYPLPKSSGTREINCLLEDSSGRVWIGTSEGLMSIDGQGELQHVDIKTAEGYTAGGVYALFEDSSNQVWIGTERKGLFLLNASGLVVSVKQTQDLQPLLIDAYVRQILEDEEGGIWVSTFNSGVTRIEPDFSSSTTFSFGTQEAVSNLSNRSRALLKDSSGTIWIGTDAGLFRWDEGETTFDRFTHDPQDLHSISSNVVTTLFEDKGGVVWVGTFNGVSKFNQRLPAIPRFELVSSDSSESKSQLVTAFSEMPNGDVWIGTFSGLWKWNSQSQKLRFLHPESMGLSDQRIGSLTNLDNDIWVGTATSGVDIVRNDSVVNKIAYDPFDPSSLSNNEVTGIFIDQQETLWISTYGGGVNRHIRNLKFKRYPIAENVHGQFSDLHVIDVAEDVLGRLWLATDQGGVMILDKQSGDVQLIRSESGRYRLLSDRVLSLLATSDGVWMGSDRGLNFFDISSQKIIDYSGKDGLASDFILSILEDDIGRIWLGTGKGLSVLSPKTGSVVNFDSSHGLQEGDFTSGAALKLSDGSLLFGGNNGFNAFHPDRVKQNTYIPPVRITRFELGNKKVNMRDQLDDNGILELQHDDRVIGFQFAALDYTAPERNQYRYMLEGFDQDWIDGGTNRQATYTNLDPGSYVFRVLGSNNDGIWNEEGASVPLVIHPAPWATWWAFAIYSLIGLLFFWQALEFNNRRLNVLAHDMSNKRIKLYLEALDETSESVLVADKRGNVMFANQTTNEILGKSPTELIRNSLYSILFQNEHEAVIAKEKVQQTGEYQSDVEYESDDGAVSTLEVIINTADHLNEADAAFVAITRDVTEKKKAEEESQAYRKTLEKLVLERTEQLEKEIRDSEAVRARLASSLAEKEDLLKEVHHRMNNNLQVITSLINIQASKASEAGIAGALDDSQQRIKSMALVYENLYQSQNLKHIDLESYVDVLTTHLLRTYAIDGLLVHVEKDVANVDLDITRAVPCGLVINELVTNALKHAFPERHGTANVCVSFVREGSDYVLTVSDDGIGLPADFKVDTSTSIGMEIVTILTKQLDGTFKFIGDRGATFQVSFPA